MIGAVGQTAPQETEICRTAWRVAGGRHRDPEVGGMHHGVQQGDPAYQKKMPFLPLISLPAIEAMRIDAVPLFRRFYALTVDDGGGGTGLAFRPFAALNVERVMNAIEHAVALPPDEVVVHRATRRKILLNIAPLTTGAPGCTSGRSPPHACRCGACPPPGCGGGMSGAITAHSSSVRSPGTSDDHDCISVGFPASTSAAPRITLLPQSGTHSSDSRSFKTDTQDGHAGYPVE